MESSQCPHAWNELFQLGRLKNDYGILIIVLRFERANEIVKHAGTILFFIFILLAMPMIKLCNKRQCA